MHITCVVGARPNFVKIGPILEATRRYPDLQVSLVHTGQHYDDRMSALFFDELCLPKPEVYLGIGGGSQAAQTGRIMIAFDEVLETGVTDCVLVVGDVNSTLACALAAAKRGIPVAHVEAGLRSGDSAMPEEINRILTDHISRYLFTTDREAERHLNREGIPSERIYFVGNVMIDTLLRHRERARKSTILEQLKVTAHEYAVCTFHRAGNVDEPSSAANTVAALETLARQVTTVMPLHPRTRIRWKQFGLWERVQAIDGVIFCDPLGYLDFQMLLDQARLVFTDSGGIQEETTMLGVPCLTFRETTDRPITIAEGTNQLVGTDVSVLDKVLEASLRNERPQKKVPELWDGKSAERIVAVLYQQFHPVIMNGAD